MTPSPQPGEANQFLGSCGSGASCHQPGTADHYFAKEAVLDLGLWSRVAVRCGLDITDLQGNTGGFVGQSSSHSCGMDSSHVEQPNSLQHYYLCAGVRWLLGIRAVDAGQPEPALAASRERTNKEDCAATHHLRKGHGQGELPFGVQQGTSLAEQTDTLELPGGTFPPPSILSAWLQLVACLLKQLLVCLLKQLVHVYSSSWLDVYSCSRWHGLSCYAYRAFWQGLGL